jgi:hypothetical protein
MTHKKEVGLSAVVYSLFMQFAVAFLEQDDSVVMSDDSMEKK